MNESNQDDSDEWKEAKNDINRFIFSRAMYHPTNNPSAHSECRKHRARTTHPASSDPIDMEILLGSK